MKLVERSRRTERCFYLQFLCRFSCTFAPPYLGQNLLQSHIRFWHDLLNLPRHHHSQQPLCVSTTTTYAHARASPRIKQRGLGGHVDLDRVGALASVAGLLCAPKKKQQQTDLYLCSLQSSGKAMAGQGLSSMALRTSSRRNATTTVGSASEPSTAPSLDAPTAGAGPPPRFGGNSGGSMRRQRGTACKPCRKIKAACDGHFPCDR